MLRVTTVFLLFIFLFISCDEPLDVQNNENGETKLHSQEKDGSAVETHCEINKKCQVKSDCNTREWCNEGLCECQPGFLKKGPHCFAAPIPSSEKRSEELVCTKFNSDYPERATSQVPSADAKLCEAGELQWDRINDTVRRLNFYRWLIGLSPAYADEDLNLQAQKAAMIMDVNNSLTHHPPKSWECYSGEGAAGAEVCGLGYGFPSPSSTLDGYIIDYTNEATLMHRRQLFSQNLIKVGIGQSGVANAMNMIGEDGINIFGVQPDFAAYPAPGYFPFQLIGGPWSFTLLRGSFLYVISAEVVELSTGAKLANVVKRMPGGYGRSSTISITFPEAAPKVNEDYEVTIKGVKLSGKNSITYVTRLVDCE